MTEDPKQIVRTGYDAVSHAYRGDDVDEETRQTYCGWIALLQPYLNPGAQVLELGCGCGLPATRELTTRYQVTGIDISPVQVERARRLVPRATFHCADMVSFPLPPNAYDAVVGFYSLIHVPIAEQWPLLERIVLTLRPGGALLMTVGVHRWTGTEADWLGIAGATMYWSHEGQDAYVRRMTENGLVVRSETFVPEGDQGGGHTLILATKPLPAEPRQALPFSA